MVEAILVAAGLLLIGLFLRVKIRLLQVLYIPAAIVAGLLGLAMSPSGLGLITESIITTFRSWPGWLISVIFAGLLLDRPARSLAESLKLAARQGIMVWIIVLGEVTLGVVVTWLFISPFYEIPLSFGQLIEAGFAGGHGTAAAMGEVYKSLRFPEGADLGFFVATVGLIFGVVSGILYVNLAVRRGWTRVGDIQIPIISGLEARYESDPIGYARTRSEVLDPLVFQLLILSAAYAVGWGLYYLLARLIPFVAQFPLFIFTLLGGLTVRELMGLFGIADLIDSGSIRRITALSMELLILSAVASLNLSAVLALFLPVSVLLLIAFVWVGFCLLVIGRRLLPTSYWFELGILNYGMSTGTTATGLMLLRVIDKDLDSGAAEDYALAAPLSAPFIGGGMITFSLPFLLERFGGAPIAMGLVVAMLLLFLVGDRLARSERSRKR
jgi:ESS family glutamate:Na+ symporter